jgi:hypothetical protein
MTTSVYMTKKERDLMNSQFQTMLQTSHHNLLHLCNDRYPETIEGVLAENPSARDPQRLVALNKRINAQSERIEDLLLSIEYGEPCPDNSFLTAGNTSEATTAKEIQADIEECFGK